ncbi:DUF1998 domain-containing protein [Saccharopolyspora gregorii]|uniref:DUF1998 domain-containing protein n=1 Tax=Saccharopolyspora gregorii TaxID=33914 RepID=A0ABP6RR69_9PSEU
MTMRKIRRSQVVSPFGPGAIVDLVGESFVAEDAGNWRGKPEFLRFPRLASFLEVSALRTPRQDENLPYFRFPQWLFCSGCRGMERWSFRMEREGETPRCTTCADRRQLIPMRLIAVCGNGHLTDINWAGWAHSLARKERDQVQCAKAELKFLNKPAAGSGLGSLEVRCDTCGADRSLEGITDLGALREAKMSCPGKQPWQASGEAEKCGETPIAMQRGASNVYFPDVVSVIDIPPEPLGEDEDSPVARAIAHADFQFVIENPRHRLRDEMLRDVAEHTGLELAEIDLLLDRVLGREEPGSQESIAPSEWVALCAPRVQHAPNAEFITRRSRRPEHRAPGSPENELAAVLADVVLVDRLREVRVLTGFKRHTMRKRVSANLAAHPTFLPAAEVFGEGFFLRFDESAIAEWETRPEVRNRCSILAARREAAKAERLPVPRPRFVLLHTLAHALLRSTAFEAGYSTSSLRERLYVTGQRGPDMAGVLIYTAAGDTEGTMGGLVRLGEHERLTKLVCAAIAAAGWCSFDPVCGETRGQGPSGMLLAACHACALVPETSCEASNRLLDRRLLIDEDYGFFAPLAAALEQVPGGGAW